MEESSNIFQIGMYELRDYIFSYSILPQIIEERHEVIESLYDDCCPTTVQPNETGLLVPITVNVEDMAIYIIEKKEGYDKMIKRYEGKAKLFEQAMNLLTDRERQVIQIQYFNRNNDSGLSNDYYSQVLHEAEQKLCHSICELQQSKFKLIRLQEKQERLQKVAEFKQAN